MAVGAKPPSDRREVLRQRGRAELRVSKEISHVVTEHLGCNVQAHAAIGTGL